MEFSHSLQLCETGMSFQKESEVFSSSFIDKNHTFCCSISTSWHVGSPLFLNNVSVLSNDCVAKFSGTLRKKLNSLEGKSWCVMCFSASFHLFK